jgi:hypothetical protein
MVTKFDRAAPASRIFSRALNFHRWAGVLLCRPGPSLVSAFIDRMAR